MRKLTFVPVLIQVVSDIMVVGISNFIHSLGVIAKNLPYHIIDLTTGTFIGPLRSETTRQVGSFDVFAEQRCILHFCREVLNDHVTGVCFLVIALERFILVVYPVKSLEILTKKLKISTINLLLVFILASSIGKYQWLRITFGGKSTFEF